MYLDALAFHILKLSTGAVATDDLLLWRMYAALALSKGADTTRRDVHDAWSIWVAQSHGEYRSLVPFDELSPEVQALDQPYVDAIHAAAKLPRDEMAKYLVGWEQATRHT